MARLSVHLLGTSQVILDGEPITDFPTDKVRALLFYLVMHAGEPLRRDTLVGLFWPDQPQKKARLSLRQALYNLRRALDDVEDDRGFLRVTRGTVCFSVDSDYFLDVAAFKERLTRCQTHPHRRLVKCLPCVRCLEEAVALYQGDLLDGFYLRDCGVFEEWVLLEREWLHRQAIESLILLTQHYQRRGDYRQMQHYAWQQVQLAPWNEEAHRQLMLLLAASGERSAALAQYEKCRQALDENLGVEPTVETTALYERIRGGADLRPPAPAHRLAPEATSFVGRERDLAHLAELVANPDCRLVTLVGPGGIGKTRLARAAAMEQEGLFAHGVYDVSLAAIVSPALIVRAIADALGFSLSGPRDPREQLVDYLRSKEILLVLDSMEHLLEGADVVVQLLAQAADLVVLATSRERLNLREEWVYEVVGLAYPETVAETLEEYSAIKLFVQRARQVTRHFDLSEANAPAIVRICQLVEGLPLGLELAAAAVALRTSQEIAQEIAHNLHTLVSPLRNVPERHRSMWAAFEHSWSLLNEDERQILARLSVFRGGFDAQAVVEIVEGSVAGLAALERKSLLQRTGRRMQMHKLLRQYAAEKLVEQVGEVDLVRDQHSRYYTGLVRSVRPHQASQKADTALAALQADRENVHAAWHWAVDRGHWEQVSDALTGLARFYHRQGPFTQGEALIREALDGLRRQSGKTSSAEMQVLPAQLLTEQASLLFAQGRYEETIATAAKALEEGAHVLEADAPTQWQQVRTSAHLYWGQALNRQCLYGQAQEHLEQALQLAQAASLVEAECRLALGSNHLRQGEHDAAQERYQQAFEIYSELGDLQGESKARDNLAVGHILAGQLDQARALYEESVRVYRQINDRHNEAIVRSNLGVVLVNLSAYNEARQNLEQAADLHRELGDRAHEAIVLGNLGWLLFDQFGCADGRHYLERALALARTAGLRDVERHNLSFLSQGFYRSGDYESAHHYAELSLVLHQEGDDPSARISLLVNLGQALAGLERPTEARAAYEEAIQCARNVDQPDLAQDARAGLARILLQNGQPRQALVLIEAVLPALEASGPADEWPFFAYYACYEVLQANGDARAPAILKAAYTLLQEKAGRIDDSALRNTFLKAMVVHREIVELWIVQGA